MKTGKGLIVDEKEIWVDSWDTIIMLARNFQLAEEAERQAWEKAKAEKDITQDIPEVKLP